MKTVNSLIADARSERIASIRKMALYFAGEAASGMTWWEYRNTVTADLLWVLEQLDEADAAVRSKHAVMEAALRTQETDGQR